METIEEFKFQGLLSKDKDGKVSGPMSPVLFAQEICKQLDLHFGRLVRWWNPPGESGYDYLIIQHSKNFYTLHIDMGNKGIPVAMYDAKDNSVELTPIYKKQLTPEKQAYHKSNCELPKYHPNVIVDFTEDEESEKALNALFVKAIDSGEFKIK